MDINHDYTAHSGNYTPGGNRCEYIAVHYTSNSAPARSEAAYAQNNQHSSSYHYVLDGYECYQLLNDTDTAWAVGTWPGYTQLISNRQAISIEVCNAGGSFSDAERDQLRELVALLMERHSIDADHVVRHWDCHTGRKECPEYYAGAKSNEWSELHDYITGGGTVSEYGWQHDDGGWWYKWWQADGGYSYQKDEWQIIDDKWYYFDSDGYALCNAWHVEDGIWYRFGDDCALLSGWQFIDGYWYHLHTEHDGTFGAMDMGWYTEGGEAFWLTPDSDGEHVLGAMAIGWRKPEGSWAYFDESGAMARDTIKRIDGKWYIFEPGGSLVEGTFSTDENGALQL